MRRVSLPGLLLTTGFILATSLAAQQPPKGPGKDDPKIPEVKVHKDSEHKWPTEIGGKKLDAWVKDIRDPDPSTREMALRTVQFFGPDASKAASVNLLHALTQDVDYGVKLTAVSMVPILGFDQPEFSPGLDYLISQLNPNTQISTATRNAVIAALGNCGPSAKHAIPNLVQYSLSEKNSWQNRQAAAIALAQIGKNFPLPPPKETALVGKEPKDPPPTGKGPKESPPTGKGPKNPPPAGKEPKDPPKETDVLKELPPDPAAIRGLIKALHDPSHMVRRTAISSLLSLGPPDPSEKVYPDYREALKLRFKDKDKSVVIWSHVLYMQSDRVLVKAQDPNLKELDHYADGPKEKDSGIRIEAIQGFGVLGEAASSRADLLLSIASRKDEDASVIVAAIWALSGMKSQEKKTISFLESLKDHENKGVQETAVAAIAHLKGKKTELKKDAVVDLLVSIANNKEGQTDDIIGAISALSGMKAYSTKILPALEELKKHKTREVQKAAEEAITVLSGKKTEAAAEEPKRDAVKQ